MEASGGGGDDDVQQQKQQQQMVPPQPQLQNNKNNTSSNSSDGGKATFRAEVKQHFETLVKQGLEPNDAAALALKIAAKIGEQKTSGVPLPPKLPRAPRAHPPPPFTSSEYGKKSHLTLDSYIIIFFNLEG